MSEFHDITSCADLNREHVVAALESSRSTRALCEHLANVARPGEGAERILFVFASLAGGYTDWFDGDLRLELDRTDDGVLLHALVDIGQGRRERIYPALLFKVPLEEFVAGIAAEPALIGPFHMHSTPKGIALSTEEEARRSTMRVPRVGPQEPSSQPNPLRSREIPASQTGIPAPPTKRFEVPPELLRKLREGDGK